MRSASQPELEGAVGAQSPKNECLKLLMYAELGRKTIAQKLGTSSRAGHLSRMLAELVSDGLIELTIPEKPNSRLQKYRLTEKGRMVLRSMDEA